MNAVPELMFTMLPLRAIASAESLPACNDRPKHVEVEDLVE